MKESARVLLALGAGLAGGAAIAAWGGPRLHSAAEAIAPIGTVWINAIRMTIIPLVVSLLITGVAGATDLRAIGRIGGRSLLTFLLLLLGTALVIVPLGMFAFRLLPGLGTARPPLPAGALDAAGQITSAGPAPGFGTWLTSLIPANPFAAAAGGAMLQLIIFALILALAIASLGATSRDTLLGFFRALSEAMLVIVRWVVALAPIGIFALVLPLAARGGAGVAGAVGFYVLVYSLACILITLLLYPAVALFARVPMGRFARAVLPAQTVAFASSSSIATLPALVEGAERVLDLPERVSGFVLPLAVSTFHVATPPAWTIGALFVGWFYGVPLGVGALATVALASVFLAFVAPGVPRGGFLMLAPLFVAIGLPVEGVGILIAVDAIPDLFATVLNSTGDLAAAAIVARHK
ncbi:MAG TPA: dicarboxylate/amino acid:cation symporter [Gemmatimonadales bacterium]|jgi:Na+/H+-dicarboxylate symporter|nr:dicarboxylate/amino acid:cation symporter [Gemmatimonadales bacterium]